MTGSREKQNKSNPAHGVAICATDNTLVGPDQVFCWTVAPDMRSREGLKLR